MAQVEETVASIAVPSLEAQRARIYRYIRSMVRDSSEADDLTQKTFLRAYVGRATLRDPEAVLGWLYLITIRVTLDRIRQKTRNEPREYSGEFDALNLADTSSPPALKVIEQREMSACVHDYINKLADGYRAVILLHDLHELTAQQIADTLNLPVATVKIRIHRARRRLQAELRAGCDLLRNEVGDLICEPKTSR